MGKRKIEEHGQQTRKIKKRRRRKLSYQRNNFSIRQSNKSGLRANIVEGGRVVSVRLQ
jgi:hypothetical protein